MPHPIQLTFGPADDLRRSRLHTFFNGLLALPHVVVLYVYQLVAMVVVLCSWIATTFTGRNPQGMHDFIANFLVYRTRVTAYILLLVREWPPFPGSDDPYAVNLAIQPPVDQGRLGAFFRSLLAIPALIVFMVLAIPLVVTYPIAWLAIMFTGKTPEFSQSWGEKVMRYMTRLNAYLYYLTPEYPNTEEPVATVSAPAMSEPLAVASPIS